MQTKTYAAMSNLERAELAARDPDTFREARDEFIANEAKLSEAIGRARMRGTLAGDGDEKIRAMVAAGECTHAAALTFLDAAGGAS